MITTTIITSTEPTTLVSQAIDDTPISATTNPIVSFTNTSTTPNRLTNFENVVSSTTPETLSTTTNNTIRLNLNTSSFIDPSTPFLDIHVTESNIPTVNKNTSNVISAVESNQLDQNNIEILEFKEGDNINELDLKENSDENDINDADLLFNHKAFTNATADPEANTKQSTMRDTMVTNIPTISTDTNDTTILNELSDAIDISNNFVEVPAVVTVNTAPHDIVTDLPKTSNTKSDSVSQLGNKMIISTSPVDEKIPDDKFVNPTQDDVLPNVDFDGVGGGLDSE